MFTTISAALVLIVFLVPGFVWRTVESQFVYLDKRLEWEKLVLGLLTRSTVVYLPPAGLIHRGWKQDWLNGHPFLVGLAALGLLLIWPSVLGFAVGVARQKQWGAQLIRLFGLRTFEQHNIPSAWDYLFSHFRASWVIITFRDQSKMYGYVGGDSYFSSDPAERDLFISRVVRPNASGELEFVPDSAGAYIRADEVAVMEFVCPPGTNDTAPDKEGASWRSRLKAVAQRIATLCEKSWKRVTDR